MARILWYIQWWQLSSLTTAMPWAHELRRRGHKITFLATFGARKSILAQGFEFRPEKVVPRHDWGRRDAMPATLERMTPEYWDWAVKGIPKRMSEVITTAPEVRADAIICDSKLIGAGLGAEWLGKPWISYIDFHIGRLRRLPVGWTDEWNTLRRQLGLRADHRPSAEGHWLTFSPHLVLIIGLPRLLGLTGVCPPYVQQVGPMSWEPPHSQDTSTLIANVGLKRPAILVSTSSSWLADSDLIGVTRQAVSESAADIVATVPSGESLPLPAGGVILHRYLPHSEVLPKVSLVICSAGLQIVTKAVLANRPIIAVPRGGDGYGVSQAVVDAGWGQMIPYDRLNPDVLKPMVRNYLSTWRPYASAMRSRAIRPSQPPCIAADHVEKLL